MTSTFTRRDVLKGGTALTAATMLAGPGSRPGPVAGAAGQRGHPGADRGRQEGRQGRSGTPRSTCRSPSGSRKPFEAKYPGIAVRVERTGAERVFQRIGQEYGEQDPRGRRGQFVRRRAFHRLEARRHARALRARGRRQALCRPSTRTRTAVRQLPRLPLRRSAYNTNLVKAETRRRASPTCSIRNGPARSSRRIRATAAPS